MSHYKVRFLALQGENDILSVGRLERVGLIGQSSPSISSNKPSMSKRCFGGIPMSLVFCFQALYFSLLFALLLFLFISFVFTYLIFFSLFAWWSTDINRPAKT